MNKTSFKTLIFPHLLRDSTENNEGFIQGKLRRRQFGRHRLCCSYTGGINLRASMTGDTSINGPSLNGLTLSVENPGFFNVDYNVPKKDVRFQFMNSVRVNGKPLNFMYTHSLVENTTTLDGTLLIDSNNKISANYGFKEHDCKVKYTYVHGCVATFEPRYDFADNSWDLAVLRRLHDGSVVRGSYQSSTTILGMDLK